jgi:DNA-binding LytR/AlgR family response regulator
MNTNRIHIGGRLNICPDEIMLLEANLNYTVLYLLGGKKITVATTLKQLEKRFIACQNFFRPHKSHIVNLDYLSDYKASSNKIVMRNHKTVLISRRKKTAFRLLVNL